MDTMLRDLRYAARTLRRAPGFALVAVITLALGIGANTAVFSVINGVLLRLPFAEPDRLVVVQNSYENSGITPTSYPDFLEWRKQSQSFEALGASALRNFTLLGRGEPRRVPGAYVSEGYFHLMGISPVIGRELNADEHRAGGPLACLISREFWRREFGGSAEALGRTLALNGKEYTVVGVIPAVTPNFYSERDLWLPLEPQPPYNQHGTNYLVVAGRLRPGATVQTAQKDLLAIQAGIDKQFPMNAHGIQVDRLDQVLLGDVRPLMLTLLAAVAFVLLIGCVNLANMLLARGSARAREYAIRRSLGATRAVLVRQALAESLLISLLGGAAGILLALAAANAVAPYLPANLRPESLGLDVRVLLFTLGASVISALAFGLVPALRVSAGDSKTSLQAGSQQAGDSRGNRRLRSVLVCAEVALATVLVSGASLTLLSLYRVLHASPGFNAQGVASLQLPLSTVRYPNEAAQVRFYQSVVERVRAIPGVESASATAYVPFGSGGQTGDFDYEAPGHQPFTRGQSPFAENHFVLPGYFHTMQIPLLRGRDFDERDRSGAPKVAIVNESMARKLWPGLDPIGRRVQFLGDWQEVVGVVADVRPGTLLKPADLQGYLAAQQYTPDDISIVLRAPADPFAAVTAAKAAVYALDAQQPVANVTLLDALIDKSLVQVRVPTLMFSIFGALALLLASIGVYGVTAYSVSRRIREFGIRMALGARQTDILRLVVGTDLGIVAVGMVVGVLAAAPLDKFLRNLLFSISEADPIASVVAVVVLAAVAVLAMYMPARRAAAVDPLVALRYE